MRIAMTDNQLNNFTLPMLEQFTVHRPTELICTYGPLSKYLRKNGEDMSSAFFQKVCIFSLLLSLNQLKTCI